MKKIFSILAFVLAFTVGASAQTAAPLSPVLDSIVTSSSLDTSYSFKKVEGWWDAVSIQVVIPKVSGTVTGYALLQGSLDGVNYANITTDTLTLANVATNSKVWAFSSVPYAYYRVAVYAPSSTYKAYVRGYILLRRKQ